MKRCWAWLRSKSRVFLRVLYEMILPTLSGIVWGILAYKTHDLFESISLGGAAFFFVFSMQGQALRINKNVRDEDNADEWRTSFNGLQEGMAELRRQRAEQPQPPEPPIRPEQPIYEQPFIDQARSSLQNQLYYPAALTASVGFENALRVAARYMKLDEGRPLTAIARQLGDIVRDKGLIDRLVTLVRLRNGLVHPHAESAFIDEEQASQLVAGFEEGIRMLDKFGVHYFTSAPSSGIY